MWGDSEWIVEKSKWCDKDEVSECVSEKMIR